MALLIAEVGNSHRGSIRSFLDMIRIAKECGADMVKAQAIKGKPLGGSMPDGFYDEASLTPFEYVEAIEYSKSIGIPLFYSIFHDDLSFLHMHQDYHKISASQMLRVQEYVKVDSVKNFVSLNDEFMASTRMQYFMPKNASILYATPYACPVPKLFKINSLPGKIKGYSCHCLGIGYAISAVKDFSAQVIEKHFTLDKSWLYRGIAYRDNTHSILPKDLEILAKEVKK